MTAFLPGFAPKTAVVPIHGLRPYQVEADAAIARELATNRSTLVVMATGLGKTRIFTHVAARTKGRVLVIAHRDELLDQARKRLEKDCGEFVEMEQSVLRAGRSRIVVASVQTLSRDSRLSRFKPDTFELLVIDESHHCLAESYRKIIDHFSDAKLLGVTATPDRQDERELGAVFDSVAFVYEINDGIRDSWLCPVRVGSVQVDAIDLAGVHTVAGDLNQGELDAVMSAEQVLHGMARPLLEQAADRRTLVFQTSVANAHRFAEILNRPDYRPGSAMAVDGKTDVDTRRRIFEAHQRGDFQFLVNVGIATEGYDDQQIACIALCRPTKSRALYTQMIGRGLRVLGENRFDTPDARRDSIAASAKPDCLVLDFHGNAGRHSLVSVLDILGGDDEELVERSKKEAKKRNGATAAEILEAARAQLAREKEMAEKRKAIAAGKVTYRVTPVDPFKAFDAEVAPWAARYSSAPSPAQIDALAKWKIPVPEKCTKAQANKLLSTAIFRANKNLANWRQTQELASKGVNAHKISMVNAGRLLAAFDRNQNLSPQQINDILGVRQREVGSDDGDERLL